jgi:CxxC motif-containing protein (DUF1111 family)
VPSFPRKRESSVVAIFLVLASALSAQDFSALDAPAGKALFELNWVQAPASASATDGLGPYYNARSCAACHANGGGGDNTLATMNLVVDDPAHGEMLQLRAVPGLEPEVRAQLTYVQTDMVTLADGARIALSAPQLRTDEQPELVASLHRAPSLAGLALLEQVSAESLQLRADPDDRNGDGISGTLARGRFGWKARTATLREQVARALSLDLGLGNPLLPSAAGDCMAQQSACLAAAAAVTGNEFEAPATVLDLLLAYLRSLPAPASPSAAGPGAKLFSELGCESCHTAELAANGQSLRPFTDLLLHDLGPALAAGADADWRTAPLWGLAQTRHFLHDGRATSLEEAVLWHGGEAERSRDAYRALNARQRAVLHDWLLGL